MGVRKAIVPRQWAYIPLGVNGVVGAPDLGNRSLTGRQGKGGAILYHLLVAFPSWDERPDVTSRLTRIILVLGAGCYIILPVETVERHGYPEEMLPLAETSDGLFRLVSVVSLTIFSSIKANGCFRDAQSATLLIEIVPR